MVMKFEVDEAAKFDGMTLTEIKMMLRDTKWVVTGNATVDGTKWYSMVAFPDIGDWIRDTYPDGKNTMWVDTTSPNDRFYRFDIHEQLYTLLLLQCQ
jgi:regulation of enolase protein 1 (concanavalin A-like superfamily)